MLLTKAVSCCQLASHTSFARNTKFSTFWQFFIWKLSHQPRALSASTFQLHDSGESSCFWFAIFYQQNVTSLPQNTNKIVLVWKRKTLLSIKILFFSRKDLHMFLCTFGVLKRRLVKLHVYFEALEHALHVKYLDLWINFQKFRFLNVLENIFCFYFENIPAIEAMESLTWCRKTLASLLISLEEASHHYMSMEKFPRLSMFHGKHSMACMDHAMAAISTFQNVSTSSLVFLKKAPKAVKRVSKKAKQKEGSKPFSRM